MSGIHLQSQRGQLCSSAASVVAVQGFGAAVHGLLPLRARRGESHYERSALQHWAVANPRSRAADRARNMAGWLKQHDRCLPRLGPAASTTHVTASRPRLTPAQSDKDTLRNVYQALCPRPGGLGDGY